MPYKKYEDTLASGRRSYQKNKDKIKIVHKLYRDLNKERMKPYFSEYQKKNRDSINKRRRERRLSDSEYRKKRIEQSRLWRKNNPEKMAFMKKKSILKHQYGLTVEEYQKMIDKNNSACYICDEVKTGTNCRNGLCVDHDHKTGKNRGLLCHSCNRAIGLLGDSIEKLKKAIIYLEKNNA